MIAKIVKATTNNVKMRGGRASKIEKSKKIYSRKEGKRVRYD